jgi:hypothetical protein
MCIQFCANLGESVMEILAMIRQVSLFPRLKLKLKGRHFDPMTATVQEIMDDPLHNIKKSFGI